MKKNILLLLNLIIPVICLAGCASKTAPDPKAPVTLTMWHVYGSQTKSPLNDIIDEFNESIGQEKGIIINVVSVTSSSAIDKALSASSKNEPGAEELPNLFTAYPRVVEIVGEDNLLSWDDYFSAEELSAFKDEFLLEGYFDDNLLMLPIAKSSEAFYLNKTLFDKFSKDCAITYEDLNTFDGIFHAANIYYDWSNGQSFTQFNDFYHYAFIGMKAYGSELIKNDTLQLEDSAFKKIWTPLAKAAIYGGICLEDGYAAARWKTVEIISNIGSTADILYQPDNVIYPDNSTEKITSITLPYPTFRDNQFGVVLRGGGLFALKNDDERLNNASVIFAKWLIEKENNLKFVTQTGYLPVTTSAFEMLFDDPSIVENETAQNLYETVNLMIQDYDFYALPLFENASELQQCFEKNVKNVLKSAHYQYKERIAAGEDSSFVLEDLTNTSLEQLKELSFH